MAYRKRYLVTYDISDDKRRTRVFDILKGYGDHAQYSVFFTELNRGELSGLRSKLRDEIHHREDQILIVDLGPTSAPLAHDLEVLGRGYEPPVRCIVV